MRVVTDRNRSNMHNTSQKKRSALHPGAQALSAQRPAAGLAQSGGAAAGRLRRNDCMHNNNHNTTTTKYYYYDYYSYN